MRIIFPICVLGLSFMLACSGKPVSSPSSTANSANESGESSTVSSGTETVSSPAEGQSPMQNPVAPSVMSQKIKKRVLVLRFLNKTPLEATQLVDRAYRETQRAVRKADETLLIPQEEIKGYEAFTFDDLSYDLKTIFLRARQNSISGVVLGSIEDVTVGQVSEESGLFRSREFQATARVNVRLYDVATEREVASETNEATATDRQMAFFSSRAPDAEDGSQAKSAVEKALEPILARFTAQIRNFDWKGRIARIELNRYYINAGEETGILKGQLLKVSSEGFPVEDPTTGNLIGQAPGRIKGVLKVVDYLGRDGAIATLHSGGGIREQDIIEIFSPK